MLSTKIETLLNQQIAEENYASHLYLAMASWCEKQARLGCAKFLFAHAEEEREHMMKLFHYINAAGGYARATSLREPPSEFKTVVKMFEQVLKHEQHVTSSINALVDTCLKDKDYSTFQFLQWYVAEQHEEEHLFQSVLDLVKMAGTDEKGMFLIDQEIGRRAEKK
ncbi:MAG: ferritin [Candidatus Omnitrophota bacterium]